MNKNSSESRQEHRGIPSSESAIIPALNAYPPFSPAPWRVQERLSGSENHKGWLIFCSLNGVVGEVYPLNSDPTPTARANARLIAAAPAMYEALKGVVRVADRRTVEFDAARAALAAVAHNDEVDK